MKYGAVIGLLLLNVDLGWAQTQDELMDQSSTSSAYANVDAQYLYSSWQPSKIVNATTEATGRNLIKFSLDPSPSIPYIKRLEYWWTPGDSADQKEIIEREAEGESAFERYIGTLQYVFLGDNSVYYNFESTAFIGNAEINQLAEYIDEDNQVSVLRPGDEISFLTVIREHEVGIDLSGLDVQLSQLFDSWGMFYQYSDYQRPYSLTFDRRFADDRIFESTIISHGLGIRFDGVAALSPGLFFSYGFDAVSGRGNIEFSNADLEDFIDDDKKLYSDKYSYHFGLLWQIFDRLDLDVGFRHEVLEIDSRLENDDVENGINHLEENMRFINFGLAFRL